MKPADVLDHAQVKPAEASEQPLYCLITPLLVVPYRNGLAPNHAWRIISLTLQHDCNHMDRLYRLRGPLQRPCLAALLLLSPKTQPKSFYLLAIFQCRHQTSNFSRPMIGRLGGQVTLAAGLSSLFGHLQQESRACRQAEGTVRQGEGRAGA